jgi:synaptic vesicle membrane protein VAT-1
MPTDDPFGHGMGLLPTVTLATAGLIGAALLRRWFRPAVSPAPATPAGPICITIPVPGGYDKLVPRALGSGTTRAADELFRSIPPAQLVTVRIKACGVNYADIGIRWGLYASWNKFGGGNGTQHGVEHGEELAHIPGFEFAGTVEAVGAGARSDFAIGDEVFGVTLFGAYSSRVQVSKDYIRKRPLAMQ